MPDALSIALQAWSLQGPTLLRSTLAVKDAQIARLTAERDANEKELASLRECISELQAAVDQLVDLCTAQVAELAAHAGEAGETGETREASDRKAETTRQETGDKGQGVQRVVEGDACDPGYPGGEGGRDVADRGGKEEEEEEESRCRAGAGSSAREVVVVDAQCGEEDCATLCRNNSGASPSAAKVARRSSFPGASSVSSTHISPSEGATSLDTSSTTEEQMRLWGGDFEDAVPKLPPSRGWGRSNGVAERREMRGDVGEIRKLDERCGEQVGVQARLDDGIPELPSDIQQFILEEGAQKRLPILARPGSAFVDVSETGQCVIKDAAFYVDGSELPCDMTVTMEPEELDSAIATFIQFEYPDSTMLPFIPVCDLRVKGAHVTYDERLGRDMQGLLRTNSYGRDYVRLQMPSRMFKSLVDRAKKLIRDLYPDAVLEEQFVPFESTEFVEFFAQLISPHPVMRGERWDASVAELLMESECDIVGDGTILMRFLERHGTTELDFVLHRMQLGDEQANVRSVV